MDDKKWRSGWILLLVLVQIGVNFVQCRPVASEEDGSLTSTSLLTKGLSLFAMSLHHYTSMFVVTCIISI